MEQCGVQGEEIKKPNGQTCMSDWLGLGFIYMDRPALPSLPECTAY